ncbi:MAG TPA: PD-(D/E)XK nuclease family protein [Spirochaetia bacterium]|nr:PD-(D/E)XK nuclease family protein [Spirochaetia bacterium]
MKAEVIPAEENLIDQVALRIEERFPNYGAGSRASRDLSRALVVFPGKRPAHFLRRRLSRTRRGGFLPPRVLSMDELVDGVFCARTSGTFPSVEPIDAVAVLYDSQLAAPHPLGGSSFMTLDAFFPLGLKIYNDLEELLIEGVNHRQVAGAQPLIEEEVPPRSRQSLQTLAWFYQEFYPAVERRGLSTRSQRYRRVAAQIEPPDLEPLDLLILAGFFTLTGAEVELFRKVAEWPQTRLLFQDGPGLARRLSALGIPGLSESSRPPRPRTFFRTSPDTHGQVFALNAALGEPEESTLVVLPDPQTLFPLLRHGLSRFTEDQYNVSLGYSLQRTPLYGFFADLMELIASMEGDRVYLSAYLSFVLHPYTKNIRFRGSAEATRVLFHTLEDRLARVRGRKFSTLREIESDDELFQDAARSVAALGGPAASSSSSRDPELSSSLRAHLARIHGETIEPFRSFRDVGDFAERCIRLISWVHESSTARDHPLFSPFSEAFVRSLETIGRSLMTAKSFTDTASYFALLRRYLQTCYVPFEGTPLHGMQVLGALETRGLHFRRVFVLDATEGTFPPAGSESTLLPLPVRAALKLSSYRDQEDIAAYHFEVLAAGAEELHLFSVEGADRSRSRFVERLLWERQQAEGVAEESSLIDTVSYRVNLENRAPDPVEKTGPMAEWLARFRYSATALDTYLRCPLRFYYRYLLNLGRREEMTSEIEPADVGLFVHAVLARYFEPRRGRPLTRADADGVAMEAVVDALFAERFGSSETGAERLLHQQVRSHLKAFVDRYLAELISSHAVSVEGLEASVETAREGHNLYGRLDLVLRRDGAPCLVDFKTSANRPAHQIRLKRLVLEDRATWPVAIPTLQLAFYVLLYSAQNGIPPTDVRALFLLLGRNELDSKIEVPLFESTQAAQDGWPVLEEVILRLLREINNLSVPFTPTPDLKSACPSCDFTGICGTAWLARG